jgi:hypothetical protein
LFYAIVISAVFLLPFLVVRAFKEIRRRKPVYLGFLKFLAISSLWLRTKGNDRIIEKRAFRIVRTRPFCEDQNVSQSRVSITQRCAFTRLGDERWWYQLQSRANRHEECGFSEVRLNIFDFYSILRKFASREPLPDG